MQEKSLDRSTLSALQPAQPFELHWRHFKSSLRTHGSHILNLRRPTRNPENSRQYIKGDPINLIDWKAYARTDQLIVRQQHDEASARVAIAIDAGETMLWPGNPSPKSGPTPPAKLEIASRVAFNLAHMHLSMGDQVELWLANKEGPFPEASYRPKSNSEVLSEFDLLLKNQFSLGELSKVFSQQSFESRRKPDVAYWLGDGLSGLKYVGFLGAAEKLRFFLHILSSLEMNVSWFENHMCYFDEWKMTKEYQGQFLLQQSNYDVAIKKWLTNLQNQIRREQHGFYSLLTDATSISEYQSGLALTD